eukprot:Rhum_TRINITY_DN13050_c2_g1::Rhum_TRINITY_DN13050_c2_g1_i1::g.56592::m.56592
MRRHASSAAAAAAACERGDDSAAAGGGGSARQRGCARVGHTDPPGTPVRVAARAADLTRPLHVDSVARHVGARHQRRVQRVHRPPLRDAADVQARASQQLPHRPRHTPAAAPAADAAPSTHTALLRALQREELRPRAGCGGGGLLLRGLLCVLPLVAVEDCLRSGGVEGAVCQPVKAVDRGQHSPHLLGDRCLCALSKRVEGCNLAVRVVLLRGERSVGHVEDVVAGPAQRRLRDAAPRVHGVRQVHADARDLRRRCRSRSRRLRLLGTMMPRARRGRRSTVCGRRRRARSVVASRESPHAGGGALRCGCRGHGGRRAGGGGGVRDRPPLWWRRRGRGCSTEDHGHGRRGDAVHGRLRMKFFSFFLLLLASFFFFFLCNHPGGNDRAGEERFSTLACVGASCVAQSNEVQIL